MKSIRTALERSAADATAGRVVSKGFQYVPDKNIPETKFHVDAQPPLRRPLRNAPDFTGIRYGRLRVLGLHATLKKRWVVRCDCGRFENRWAKTIRNAHPEDSCDMCKHTMYLRRHAIWLSTDAGKAAPRKTPPNRKEEPNRKAHPAGS